MISVTRQSREPWLRNEVDLMKATSTLFENASSIQIPMPKELNRSYCRIDPAQTILNKSQYLNAAHMFRSGPFINHASQLIHRPDIRRRFRLVSLLVRVELLVELRLLIFVVILALQVGADAGVVECSDACSGCDGHTGR